MRILITLACKRVVLPGRNLTSTPAVFPEKTLVVSIFRDRDTRQSTLERRKVHGLHEVVIETGRASAHSILLLTVARQGDETNPSELRHRSQPYGKSIAINLGKAQVEECHLRVE